MIPAHLMAPGGRLRAAINLGNPVLARRDAASGDLAGVTVALAREIARRAGLALDLVPFAAAGAVVEARRDGAWDIAFLAIDPARAGEIAFTAPYTHIDGVFAVRREAPFHGPEDLDRPGVRIVVGRGAAYDLHLTRTLRAAELVRVATSAEVLPHLLATGLEAGAGIREAVAAFVAEHPELRLIEPPFMRIAQAIAVASDSPEVLAGLNDFVGEVTASGFVAAALAG